MAGPTYRPGSASGNSQRLGLLVECKEAGGFDRLGEFPNFGRLARLHVCIERVRPLARSYTCAWSEWGSGQLPNALGP